MGYNTRRVSLSLPSLGIALPGSSHSRQHHQQHRRSAPSSATATPAAAQSPSATTPSNNSSASPPTAQKNVATGNSTKSSSSSATSSSSSSTTVSSPPTKRLKRSHTLNVQPATSMRTTLPTRPRKSTSISVGRPRGSTNASRNQGLEQKLRRNDRDAFKPALLGTPPPSPRGDSKTSKIDTEGINDDIVVAVIEQLEETGNRPHLIKDLVAVLRNTLSTVASSQNPTAIISSRLTTYLKRPWTALAPCPLTKEQVTVHPRRVYYYLTTSPRQEIPEYAKTPLPNRHVISPSISSGTEDEEDGVELTPEDQWLVADRVASPEVEFPIPDYLNHAPGYSDTPFGGEVFPGAPASDMNLHMSRNTRHASPALETDEREFTHTASVLQLRRQTEQAFHNDSNVTNKDAVKATANLNMLGTLKPDGQASPISYTESDTLQATTLSDQATDTSSALLFGSSQSHLLQDLHMSSPVIRAQTAAVQNALIATPQKRSSVNFAMDMDIDGSSWLDYSYNSAGAWGDVKSPEHVELDELDDMFCSY